MVTVTRSRHQDTPRARWVQDLVKRRGKQKAIVALANKNSRVIWALMASGESYRPTAA